MKYYEFIKNGLVEYRLKKIKDNDLIAQMNWDKNCFYYWVFTNRDLIDYHINVFENNIVAVFRITKIKTP